MNRLTQLNERLAQVGDPARLRYVLVEDDPHIDGERAVTVTIQLPEPARSATWPIKTSDRYRNMLSEHLKPLPISTVSCMLRTPAKVTPFGAAIPQ